eukprot:gene32902-42582_t
MVYRNIDVVSTGLRQALHREVDKDLQQLLDRVDASLQWIVNNAKSVSSSSPTETSDKPPSIPYINWDLIANSEIHILHKLGNYLKQHMENSVQLYCPTEHASTRDPKGTGACVGYTNSQVRVTSFDGSKYLADTLTHFIANVLPQPNIPGENVNLTSLWKYEHHAMSDGEGKAYFTKQDKDFNAGYEGGSISKKADSNKFEEVNMTSVDHYLEVAGIQSLDILKIDTEGNDNKVLLALTSWDSTATQPAGQGSSSGTRAAFSALAYDVLSFPMMIGVYMNPSPHSSTAAEDGARAQLKAQLHQ